MDKSEVEAVVKNIDVGSFPIPVVLTVGTCSETGRPKVSAGLVAPDTRAKGLRVKTGIHGGGIGWPPHTVVIGDGADERAVVTAARMAVGRAVSHEVDEHFKYRGELFVDPHPEAKRG